MGFSRRILIIIRKYIQYIYCIQRLIDLNLSIDKLEDNLRVEKSS